LQSKFILVTKDTVVLQPPNDRRQWLRSSKWI